MTEFSSTASLGTTESGIQWPMTKDAYEMGKSIGQGATSLVYEALSTTSKKKCAMKIIDLEKCSTSASLDEINREIKSMKNMKNDNIVAYYASFVADTKLCIVMDLCQRGSLLDVIKYTQNKQDITYGVFDEGTIATILRDVLRGLAYIHENGLVHRDLKCGNLLVKDDGLIQIADFGVAGFLATQPMTATGSVDMRRYTFVGTPCWMAPEVMQQARGYNQKADIWSLGITTIEMATGQAPYAKYAPMKVLMLTLQNDPPDIDTVATIGNQYVNYRPKYRKFTRACLMKDPNQRPTARELLQNPYIKSKAKDRELLCRVMFRGEVPLASSRTFRRVDDRSESRDPRNATSTEWTFDTPESGEDSDDQDCASSVPRPALAVCHPDDDDFGANSNWTTTAATGNKANNPLTPNQSTSQPRAPFSTPVSPDDSNEIKLKELVGAMHTTSINDPSQAANVSTDVNDGEAEPEYPMLRITLRKRNKKKNYELQDISFMFQPNKDSADVLARELVEADLLDGCDLLLVAHNMSELITNPTTRERIFPLNSPPAIGQAPIESELHGYAKVLLRVISGPQSSEVC